MSEDRTIVAFCCRECAYAAADATASASSAAYAANAAYAAEIGRYILTLAAGGTHVAP